jgi:alkaline phosphatase D
MPDQATSFRVGVVCCARWGWNDFAAYERLADDAPDVVLHLGDYIYEVNEIPPAGPPAQPRRELRTLDDYRTRFAHHRRHPALLRLHASAPMLALWDDHEVADNAPTDDDESARARRAAGMRAWTEWMPVHAAHGERPLDRTLTVDGLLDLTIVDARFSGRDPTDTDGPSTPDSGARLLNGAQWTALEQRLRDASSPWHLVANQIQVGRTRLGWVPTVRPPFVRPLVNPDQWDGFPEERERLYAALGRARGRAVVLSGDLHSAWFRELRHRRRRIGHELTCPAVAGESYAYAFRRRTHLPALVLRTAITMFNRGIEVLELDRHGHLLLDVTPDRIDATFVLDQPSECRTVTIDRR